MGETIDKLFWVNLVADQIKVSDAAEIKSVEELLL